MYPVLGNVQRQLQLTPTTTKRKQNMRGKKYGQVLVICYKTLLKPAVNTEIKQTNKQSYYCLKCTTADSKAVPLPQNIIKANQQFS